MIASDALLMPTGDGLWLRPEHACLLRRPVYVSLALMQALPLPLAHGFRVDRTLCAHTFGGAASTLPVAYASPCFPRSPRPPPLSQPYSSEVSPQRCLWRACFVLRGYVSRSAMPGASVSLLVVDRGVCLRLGCLPRDAMLSLSAGVHTPHGVYPSRGRLLVMRPLPVWAGLARFAAAVGSD